MNQIPQHKTRDIKPDRRESGEQALIHWHRRQLPKQNIDRTGTDINKWNLMKLKAFSKEKDTINRTKWQPIEQEKISQIHIGQRANIQNK